MITKEKILKLGFTDDKDELNGFGITLKKATNEEDGLWNAIKEGSSRNHIFVSTYLNLIYTIIAYNSEEAYMHGREAGIKVGRMEERKKITNKVHKLTTQFITELKKD